MIGDDTHYLAFAALRDAYASAEAAESRATDVTASRIVAYARRGDAISDLQIEGALRRSGAVRDLYKAALGNVVRASSLSVAAAADRVSTRWVGDWLLEIIEEADGMPWLVIHAPEDGPGITMMELRRPHGSGRRVELGDPVDRVFQVPLDQNFEELAGLVDWLQDPLTAIHLL